MKPSTEAPPQIDPRIAPEFLAVCHAAFAHRLSNLELGTVLLAYGHQTFPHVAPAYLRSLIADAILDVKTARVRTETAPEAPETPGT